MNDVIALQALLAQTSDRSRQLTSFGLICLGTVESLSSGTISATDSVRLLFHAANCEFVRDVLADATAEEIMSRGVQLPDLFEALPAETAHQEYQRELAAMHALCLRLIGSEKKAA